MNEPFLLSIMATGFVVAFAHAAIPTHWLPFVMAGRGQRWSKGKTLMVVALCGAGHVLFTTMLGVLVVWLGIETSKWTGTVFPWIAGGALILFGLYYLVRQARGEGHGHSHFGSGGHSHGGHGGHSHGHSHAQGPNQHTHGHEDETKRIDTGHGMLLLEVFEDGVPPRFRLRAEAGGFARNPAPRRSAAPKSDRAVIVSLFTLLTFSPCEGFLPVYLSGISYGWPGFLLLSAVLSVATISGMVIFTWLTMSGIERLRLEFLERYESGILGSLLMFLGVGIIFLGF